MTIYGWITMLLSVGSVVFFLSWCFYKALSTPQEPEKLHGGHFVDLPESALAEELLEEPEVSEDSTLRADDTQEAASDKNF